MTSQTKKARAKLTQMKVKQNPSLERGSGLKVSPARKKLYS